MAKRKNIKTPQQALPKVGPKATVPTWLQQRRWHGWFIFALAFGLYAPSIGYDYALDDAIVIYSNQYVKQGIAGFGKILSSDAFEGFFGSAKQLVEGGRYRPLTMLMFALEWQIAPNQPWLGHFINVLLYALTCVLLYHVLRNLLGDKVEGALLALATALLFAAHPIHSEAVANIKGRDEIVALLGSLGALWCSARALQTGRWAYHLGAALIFWLAMLAKENAITYAAVVPLALYALGKQAWPKALLSAWPYALGIGAYLLLRQATVPLSIGGEVAQEMMNNPYIKVHDSTVFPAVYVFFSAEERWASILLTLGKYVGLLLWPHPLTHDYYPRHIGIHHLAEPGVVLSLLLYIGLGLWAIAGTWQRRVTGFAAAYYLVTLSIVSNIVFPIGTNMGERFVFMPSLGFCLALAALLFGLFGGRYLPSRSVPWSVLLVGLIVLAYGAKTLARNPVWKDNYTLFSSDVRHSPNSAKIRNALGGVTLEKVAAEQDPQRKAALIAEARSHLQGALAIHPNYKNAWLLLGNTYYYEQQYAQAIEPYQKALLLDDGYADARIMLGDAYEQIGVQYGTAGQLSTAVEYFKQAILLRPEEAKLHFFLGSTYMNMGDPQKALQSLLLALEKTAEEDNKQRIYPVLAQAYAQLGDAAKAAEYEQKARTAQ